MGRAIWSVIFVAGVNLAIHWFDTGSFTFDRWEWIVLGGYGTLTILGEYVGRVVSQLRETLGHMEEHLAEIRDTLRLMRPSDEELDARFQRRFRVLRARLDAKLKAERENGAAKAPATDIVSTKDIAS
jgi:hypothetical protein